jgi:hypothetical protein
MSLDAKALQKLPLNLMPTNLEGVHSFFPPPKGTDLTKADRGTLLKHGVWMRRPDPDREPKLFAMWHRYVTQIWTEENFVPPVFEVSNDIPHNLKGTLTPVEGGYASSGGWSGVVAVGKWVGAMGMWKVPKVSVPSTPAGVSGVWQSSSWVGLDGAGAAGVIPGTTTTDVLQTGVSHNIGASSGGQLLPPAYYAWYEWVVDNYMSVESQFPYVLPIIITSATVSAGDEISAIVQYIHLMGDNIANPLPTAGPYHFGGVMLTNVTTGKPIVNLPLLPPTGASFAGDSAEWIVECPAAFERGTLPNFSSVNFRSAAACNVGDAAIGVELGKAAQITYEDSEGNVETSVSASTAMVNINYQST